MNRLPLRRSLPLGMIVLTAAALTATGVISTVVLRADLVQRIDDQLRPAGALAREQFQTLGPPTGGDTPLRAVVAPTAYVVEVGLGDGQVLRLSGPPDLPLGALLDQAPAPPADGTVSAPATVDAGAYRAVSIRLPGVTVAVAQPMAPVDQTVGRLVLVEAVTGAVVLALLAVFGRLLLVHGMRPLDEITATAVAIAGGDLDRRVPAAGPDARTEVGRLTLAVNGMLARLQAALAAHAGSEERMRRFLADVSHEVRTPLTSIRGYVQLLRQGIVTVEDRPDVLRRVDDETARLTEMVDGLLYLARLDAEPTTRHEPFDLAVVVRDALADALAVQPGRPATLDVPARCPISGDEDAVRQVMTNLLANVRAHTPRDVPVTVRLTREDGTARVEVADAGPGMPSDVAERAFDRFTRAEPGRSGGGSGLGLAIAARIVAAHAGEVHLDSRPGAGTRVSFTLPAPADS